MSLKSNLPHVNLLTTPGVVAMSTCRGCVIEGNSYSGFNACHYTGDTDEHVAQCRQQLCAMLGIDRDNLIIPRQTHSLNVAVIDTIPFNAEKLENVDAIVTTLSGVAIAINTADCVPLVFADDVNKVIGVAHSGWKGTVGRIASKTVEQMVACGASLSNIKVAMGPCICGDCFEVGHEVVEQFVNNGFDSPQVILNQYQPRPHIDLPQACRQALIEIGIREENIQLPTHCSRCNPQKFFSARRLGINSGRTLTVAMMKGKKIYMMQ